MGQMLLKLQGMMHLPAPLKDFENDPDWHMFVVIYIVHYSTFLQCFTDSLTRVHELHDVLL